jgi:hypothetical protein
MCGYGTERLRQLQAGQYPINRLVKIEPASLGFLDGDHPGERLRYRPDLESGLGSHGRSAGRIGESPHDHTEDLVRVGDRQSRTSRVRQRQAMLQKGPDTFECFGQPRHGAAYSPKKSLSSRAADSTESLP